MGILCIDYSMSGSKLLMSAAVHFASCFDVFLIVTLGILMYSRKQSLDHRPSAWISHLGQPAAAAVEAVPILSECDDMLATPFVVSESSSLMSFLDKKRPFWKVNRGPDLEGCTAM